MEWCKPEPASSKGRRPPVQQHGPGATVLAPDGQDRQLLALPEPILPAQPGWEQLMRASREISFGEKKQGFAAANWTPSSSPWFSGPLSSVLPWMQIKWSPKERVSQSSTALGLCTNATDLFQLPPRHYQRGSANALGNPYLISYHCKIKAARLSH